MPGLLNGKQLKDGSVTPNKLSEQYLKVNERGEVTGDLIVTGDTKLSETATYKGAEIATKGDLYDEGGIKDLINELDKKKQDKLIAGENIQIEPDGVTISSSIKVAGSDRVLTYDSAGLKANISVTVDGNEITFYGKNSESDKPYVLAEFNVLQSQIIEDVYIDDATKELVITFIVDGDPGTETVRVDLTDFIDVYTGSEFLDVDSGTISLNLQELKDNLISDGFAKNTDIPTNGDFVDLTSSQDIGGVKTFTSRSVVRELDAQTDAGTIGTRKPFYVGYIRDLHAAYIEPFRPTNTGEFNITTNVGWTNNPFDRGYFKDLYKNGVSVATVDDIPTIDTNRLVTTNTDQTITGYKSFSSLSANYVELSFGIFPDKVTSGVGVGASDRPFGYGYFTKVIASGEELLAASSISAKTDSNFSAITSLGGTITLDNYDMRSTIATSGTYTLGALTSAKDGFEYIISVNNTSSGNVTINIPSSYQSNEDNVTINSGKVGEIFVRYIFGKYLIRV